MSLTGGATRFSSSSLSLSLLPEFKGRFSPRASSLDEPSSFPPPLTLPSGRPAINIDNFDTQFSMRNMAFFEHCPYILEQST